MRLATSSDLPLILEALKRHQPELEKRGFVGRTDLWKAYSSLESEIESGNGYVIRDFLVMVAEVKPWYSNDKVLQEWFTMSLLSDPFGVWTIVPALESIALQRDCTILVMGDTSSKLERIWVNSGMSPYGQSFFKKV